MSFHLKLNLLFHLCFWLDLDDINESFKTGAIVIPEAFLTGAYIQFHGEIIDNSPIMKAGENIAVSDLEICLWNQMKIKSFSHYLSTDDYQLCPRKLSINACVIGILDD